jgi:hypothetical protein
MTFRWGDYIKDHTKKHKHTTRANAVADGTYSCNWGTEVVKAHFGQTWTLD